MSTALAGHPLGIRRSLVDHTLGICRSIAGHPLGIGRTLADNKHIVHALRQYQTEQESSSRVV